MAGAVAVQGDAAIDAARHLYERIGTFLFLQHLEPNPTNFAFAYHIVSDPGGPLARSVAALTDGGVRLTQRDIHSLDQRIDPTRAADRTEGLVAETQMRVEGFADLITGLRAEARDFGRDLAASADAIREHSAATPAEAPILDQVARLTADMLRRVHDAESRLEQATREANELRGKLEEARANALRDPLTGLPNRRAFEEAYVAEAAAGTPLCVAVCDVDHFKSVNDRFGHAVGDRVLRAIAEALTEACEGHLVARHGGEEFAILLRATLEQAGDTIEAARRAVAAKRYRLRENDAPLGEVTFSAGIAAAQPGEVCGTVFHRADRLLYRAKADGRNCWLAM